MGKFISFKDGKLIVKVDTNNDGQPVVDILVDLSEVADEIVGFFTKKKEEPKAE